MSINKYVAIGIPSTIGELKSMIDNYPEDTPFSFINQEQQELFEGDFDRGKSVGFQPLYEMTEFKFDNELDVMVESIEFSVMHADDAKGISIGDAMSFGYRYGVMTERTRKGK